MTHDPFCPFADRIEDEAFRDIPCGICNLIAKAREDTLAKCIEVVEELFTIDRWAGLYLAANALRALEENP